MVRFYFKALFGAATIRGWLDFEGGICICTWFVMSIHGSPYTRSKLVEAITIYVYTCTCIVTQCLQVSSLNTSYINKVLTFDISSGTFFKVRLSHKHLLASCLCNNLYTLYDACMLASWCTLKLERDPLVSASYVAVSPAWDHMIVCGAYHHKLKPCSQKYWQGLKIWCSEI